MRRLRRGITSCRGQNLVEFALIAPVMFILLFGIIDFGLALNQRITFEHAAKEGARYASVHLTQDPSTCLDVLNRANERICGATTCNTVASAGQVTVSYWHDTGGGTEASTTSPIFGDTVRVSIPYHFKIIAMAGGWSISGNVKGEAALEEPIPNAPVCSR